MLPNTRLATNEISYKNNRLRFCRPGGYFCDLSLLPIAYPRPNAVKAGLIPAIRLSIGNTLFRTKFPKRVSM